MKPLQVSEENILRRIRFRPYRKGYGPTFALTTYDAGLVGTRGQTAIGYRLTQREGNKRKVLFQGKDFYCSPMHAIDSDECISSLMGFLTLRPGDTDEEYFRDYTPAQIEYCQQHAEALQWEVISRFGDY